jgi:altronate dehydratase
VVGEGGSVLVPESDPVLANAAFRQPLFGDGPVRATLSYGLPVIERGLHVVATETDHWVENLTGLGGCGAQLALTMVSGHAQQGHPLVPVIQVAESGERGRLPADDIDAFLTGDPEADEGVLFSLIASVAQGQRVPVSLSQGFVDFQLTRGLLGVTT